MDCRCNRAAPDRIRSPMEPIRPDPVEVSMNARASTIRNRPASTPWWAWLAGALAVLAFLGYLAYGFTWAWPERWEHQLLLEEIEQRRRDGKWRWER